VWFRFPLRARYSWRLPWVMAGWALLRAATAASPDLPVPLYLGAGAPEDRKSVV